MQRRILIVLAPVTVAAIALGVAITGGNADDDAALARSAAASTSTTPAATSTTTIPPTTTTAPPLAALDRRGAPIVAQDPAGLAVQLEGAERAIRDPATSETQMTVAGHLQQIAYRRLADNPAWDAEVRSRMPADLVPVVEAHTYAARELRALVRRPQAMMPAWRIVAPRPLAELRTFYAEGQAAHGVPWQYLAAVHLTETRMSRLAGTSSAGAQGPMQFLPSTWAAYGEGDINDDHDAILGAARYLAANGGSCTAGQPCDLQRALHRYNPTPRYVNAVTVYAEQMKANELTLRGYYHWQVYYLTTLGDALLPVGYGATERRPVSPADVG